MQLHIVYYDKDKAPDTVKLGRQTQSSDEQRVFKLEGTDTEITFHGYDFNGVIYNVGNSEVEAICNDTDIAEPTNPIVRETDPTPLGGKRRKNRKTKRRASRGKRTVKRHGKKRY